MRYITKQDFKSLTTLHVCPYCMDETSIEFVPLCCGEVHVEIAYDFGDEILLRNEFEIVEDSALETGHEMSDKWKESEDR